jgi:hypothetical protein
MSYFARVVNSIVENVIVAEPEYIETLPDKELYIQTYLDGGPHKNYASVGYSFDANLNAFIPPKPFPSWILNEFYCDWYASQYELTNTNDPNVKYFLSITKQNNLISGTLTIGTATQPLINPVVDEQNRRLSFNYVDINNNTQTLIMTIYEGFIEDITLTVGGMCKDFGPL